MKATKRIKRFGRYDKSYAVSKGKQTRYVAVRPNDSRSDLARKAKAMRKRM